MSIIPIRRMPLAVAGSPSAPFNSILGTAYNFQSATGFIEWQPGVAARDCVVGYRSGDVAQTMAGMFSHLLDFQHYGVYLAQNGSNYNLLPLVHLATVANAGLVRPTDTLRIQAFGAVKPPEIYVNGRLAYAFGVNDGGDPFNAPCAFGFHGPPYQADVSINEINNTPTASTIQISRLLVGPSATVIASEGYTNSVTPSGTIAAASPQVVGVAFPVTFTYVLGVLPYDHVDLYLDGQLILTLFLGLDALGVSGLTSPQVANITINTPGLHRLVARYYNAALKWRQTVGITVQVN